jgi:methyl-accepting chemotaxis protein
LIQHLPGGKMNFGGLKAKILIGVGVPVLMLFILGVVTINSVNSIKKTEAWVEHTEEVISAAKEILISAVNMETGMRGYLLAGKDQFLAPLKNGEGAIAKLIGPLQKKVSDNPKQVKRLGELKILLGQWKTNVIDPTIILRREINAATTIYDLAKIVGQAKGKRFFDLFRKQIDTFISRERALLEKQTSEYKTVKAQAKEADKTVRWIIHTYKVINKAEELLASAIDMETSMRGFLLAGQEDFLEPYNRSSSIFFSKASALAKTISDNPAQVKLLGKIQATIRTWRKEIGDPMIALRRQVKNGKSMDDLANLIGEERGKVYFDQIRKILSAFVIEETRLSAVRKAENHSITNKTIWTTLIILVSGLLVSILIGHYLANNVLKQVGGEPNEIAVLARNISDGDLTKKFDSVQEAVGINKAIQIMSENLKQLTLNIREASVKVSATVRQISGTISVLTSGAAEQAAAINQTTSTLEEIKATSNQTLTKAQALGEIADQTSEEGKRGEEKLQQTVSSMQSIREKVQAIADTNLELSQQTKQIGQITAAVNTISHQSKMLSINASIEASKAGEAGKGFSVVAEQIGNLAEQSEESTAQVSKILDNIQAATSRALIATEEGTKEVDKGVELVEQTSEIMGVLSEAIHKTGTSCQQIVAAVRQESVGIEQITVSMYDINEATAQSLSTANESKMAAENLSDAVVNLESNINVYKV